MAKKALKQVRVTLSNPIAHSHAQAVADTYGLSLTDAANMLLAICSQLKLMMPQPGQTGLTLAGLAVPNQPPSFLSPPVPVAATPASQAPASRDNTSLEDASLGDISDEVVTRIASVLPEGF